jgi:hypothetical protein
MPTGKPRDLHKERFWRQMLRRWRKSGLAARVFCAQHGLSEANLYAWRRTLAARDTETVTFAPVRVLPDESLSDSPPVGSAAFELILANQRVLRIGCHFDAATLDRLLRVLETLPPCS